MQSILNEHWNWHHRQCAIESGGQDPQVHLADCLSRKWVYTTQYRWVTPVGGCSRSQHVEHHQGCRQHCFILNLRLWLHQWRTDQIIFMVRACLALIGLQAQTEQFYWKQNLSHITSYNSFSCSLRVHTLPVLCLAWENFNLCINRFNDYVTQWVSCPTLSFEPLAWLHITCIRTATQLIYIFFLNY